ncbi:retention module-containing protein [Achromobacter sp.]|uniref:retention module-containing protein n=1 Tax=Achromobacter sp. TaxID=134375 RepID=UPI002F94396F
MANTSPAIVNEISGRAWLRHGDGSLTELHQGSKVPAGSDVVTASGATVSLQVENGLPIVIGEGRMVALTNEMTATLDDLSEAAVALPSGTDSDRLLAALRDGRDLFDELDPTAAVLAGGGGDGGSSFVRLARLLETTNPLDLVYSDPGHRTDVMPRVSSSTGSAVDDDEAPPLVNGNRAPTASDDSGVASEDSPLDVGARNGVLANDSDPDGNTLAVSHVNGNTTYVGLAIAGSQGGTFTLNADGSYSFNPGSAFQHLGAGEKVYSTITYTVSDGEGGTSTAVLTVEITGTNDVPVLQAQATYVLEDHTASGNVLAGAVDVDDDALTVTTFTLNGATYSAGSTAYIAGTGSILIKADGSYVFTPDSNWNGDLPQVTYTVTDGTATTSSTLDIGVRSVNDAPVSQDGSGNFVAGNRYVFGLKDFPFSDQGEGHTMKSVIIDSLPLFGTLLLNGKAIAQGQEVSAEDLASGKLVFLPDAGNFGDNDGSSFDFRVKDSGGTAHGGQDTSHLQTFKLNAGQFIVGDNGNADRNDAYDTQRGSNGNDVMLGDQGGVIGLPPPPPDPAEWRILPDPPEREAEAGSRPTHVLAPLDNDALFGNDGSDILFGDAINTDQLPWGIDGNPARPEGMLDGSGLWALKKFLFLKNGEPPTDADLHKFITDNHDMLDAQGDTRGGHDWLYGDRGDDILYGQGGNDKLQGGAGHDILSGGTGNDNLEGNAGNDVLIGGMGNDILSGNGHDFYDQGRPYSDGSRYSDGSDTFKWALNDQGTTSAPAIDTIKDFSTLKPIEGGDILDLQELLIGESDATLTNYLNFSKEGNHTVIDVNTQGKLDTQGADQKIVLENVDLTHDLYGQSMSNQAIINDLLQKGKLNVDHA